MLAAVSSVIASSTVIFVAETVATVKVPLLLVVPDTTILSPASSSENPPVSPVVNDLSALAKTTLCAGKYNPLPYLVAETSYSAAS